MDLLQEIVGWVIGAVLLLAGAGFALFVVWVLFGWGGLFLCGAVVFVMWLGSLESTPETGDGACRANGRRP